MSWLVILDVLRTRKKMHTRWKHKTWDLTINSRLDCDSDLGSCSPLQKHIHLILGPFNLELRNMHSIYIYYVYYIYIYMSFYYECAFLNP